jgi:putative DNA primase/helicase
VWNKGRWNPDAEMLAEDTIKLELRKIANWLAGTGAAEKEAKNADKDAKAICSSSTLSAVSRLVKIDRAIAVSPESLDFNPWILNTPGGIVDLKTGQLGPPDPDQLCSRSTAVAPASGAPKLWLRFLEETTKGDRDLIAYLKRLGGYCLTGVTIEQMYAFVYGEGGNGKGTFLNVLMGILSTYHRDSPMETFVASNHDRHPTELAHLAGARFVTASETEAGKRWDEAKLKRMTGGDPITARGMREDFFTYLPKFKLIFIGNHKPEIRNLDHAMKRRTHLVPFPNRPETIDLQLGEKLREEWPQILTWLIEGCLDWQQTQLQPPASVLAATADYFTESDTLGAWLEECCTPSDDFIELVTLYDSWESWCGRRRESPGRSQAFSSRLAARGYTKRLGPKSRRAEFSGITLNGKDQLKGLVAG